MKTEDIFALIVDPPPSPPQWVNQPDRSIKKVIDKAYRDATYDFYKHAFKSAMVANFMETGKIPITPDNAMQVELLEQARDRVITKSPYILLTINIAPGITFKELEKQIIKFSKRKIIRAYKYVYEIRDKKQDTYTGIHCHMILQYTCKPYDFKRSAQSTFKNVCDVKNKSILNIRYIDPSEIPDKIEYIKGKKQDKKKKGVELTKLWRKENTIAEIYESELPLGTEVPLLGSVENEIID